MGNSVSYLADSITYVKKTVRYIVTLPLKYMSKEEQEMANSGVGPSAELHRGEDAPQAASTTLRYKPFQFSSVVR